MILAMALMSWKSWIPRPHSVLWAFKKARKKVKVLVVSVIVWLFVTVDRDLPGSSIHGILKARILEWVAIPFYRGLSPPRDWTWVSCIAGRFFTV